MAAFSSAPSTPLAAIASDRSDCMPPEHHDAWCFARRSGAAIIDYLIYGSVYFLYVRYFGTDTGDGYEATGCADVVAVVAAWLAWLPLPEAVFGKTLGKWAFDLRVVDINGQPATAGQAFLRRLFDPVDLLFFFGPVAFVVAKTNPQAQRVGDLVAQTRVVDDATNRAGAAARGAIREKIAP
jgi:uncharacterized RDD family membrane protein YckC